MIPRIEKPVLLILLSVVGLCGFTASCLGWPSASWVAAPQASEDVYCIVQDDFARCTVSKFSSDGIFLNEYQLEFSRERTLRQRPWKPCWKASQRYALFNPYKGGEFHLLELQTGDLQSYMFLDWLFPQRVLSESNPPMVYVGNDRYGTYIRELGGQGRICKMDGYKVQSEFIYLEDLAQYRFVASIRDPELKGFLRTLWGDRVSLFSFDPSSLELSEMTVLVESPGFVGDIALLSKESGVLVLATRGSDLDSRTVVELDTRTGEILQETPVLLYDGRPPQFIRISNISQVGDFSVLCPENRNTLELQLWRVHEGKQWAKRFTWEELGLPEFGIGVGLITTTRAVYLAGYIGNPADGDCTILEVPLNKPDSFRFHHRHIAPDLNIEHDAIYQHEMELLCPLANGGLMALVGGEIEVFPPVSE